jgi:hypothetical protein
MGGECRADHVRHPGADRPCRDIGGVHDDVGGLRSTGERSLDPFVGVHDRQAARQSDRSGIDRVHAQRRQGEREQDGHTQCQ